MTDNYFFVNAFLGNFCMLCVMFLIQPFVQLVFGKLYVLDETTAGLMAVNLMLTIMLQLRLRFLRYTDYIIMTE